jgi:S1-C subfamily serine protease
VFIYGPAKEGGGVASGTGFFIGPTHVVTNRHVAENIRPDRISVTNKRLGRALSARIVAASEPDPQSERTGMRRPDLAVLEAQAAEHAFMKIGPSPAKMQDVWAVGYPGYVTFNIDAAATRKLLAGDLSAAPDSTIERGYVTTKPQGLQIATIVHSAKIAPGNSGGPLADICGRVVGVNTAFFQEPDHPIASNLAQDASVLTAFLSAHQIGAEIDNSACTPQVAAAPPAPDTASTPQGAPPAGGRQNAPPPSPPAK